MPARSYLRQIVLDRHAAANILRHVATCALKVCRCRSRRFLPQLAEEIANDVIAPAMQHWSRYSGHSLRKWVAGIERFLILWNQIADFLMVWKFFRVAGWRLCWVR